MMVRTRSPVGPSRSEPSPAAEMILDPFFATSFWTRAFWITSRPRRSLRATMRTVSESSASIARSRPSHLPWEVAVTLQPSNLEAVLGSFTRTRLHMKLEGPEEKYRPGAGTPSPDAEATLFHETMHFFQTIFTGYGHIVWFTHRQA